MPTTKDFNPRDLLDEELPYRDPSENQPDDQYWVLANTLVGKNRWSLIYDLVFQERDQRGTDLAWKAQYSVGATEQQENAPGQYASVVRAVLVRGVEKAVRVWESE